MRFWRHKDEIEGRLRSARPDARPELVRAIADRIAPRPAATRRSLAFAVVLTALLLSAFAATGGISYAADAVSSTVSSATSKLTGSSSTGGTTGGGGGCYSPSCDQYEKKVKIRIVKKTIPSNDYSTTFTFTGHPSGTIANGGSRSEDVLVGQSYVSTEAAKDGWKLTDITCDSTHVTKDLANRKVTFMPTATDANGVITCTFTNTQLAKIKVWKKTYPAGAYDKFTFTGAINAQLMDGQYKYEYVVPGTYYVTEQPTTGWKLTKIECTDSDSSGDVSTGKATFKVTAGEFVICYFTNTKQKAHIIVKKKTDPAGAYDKFTFSGALSGQITDGKTIEADVDPGTYYVTEAATSGWKLTSITCSDSDSSGSVSYAKATYKVAAGETVTCTFTNTKEKAKIIVKKKTDPAGAYDKFTFSGDLAGQISDGQTIEKEVSPGTYTVTEAAASGWNLTSITCSDSDSSGSVSYAKATYKVAAGETVTCTFLNTKKVKKLYVDCNCFSSSKKAFSGTVALITDEDTSKAASTYSATIDWGDGTTPTNGTISGSGGKFNVNGSHTYSKTGTFYIKVTVKNTDGRTASVTCKLIVTY
jgi:hypothetical protein